MAPHLALRITRCNSLARSLQPQRTLLFWFYRHLRRFVVASQLCSGSPVCPPVLPQEAQGTLSGTTLWKVPRLLGIPSKLRRKFGRPFALCCRFRSRRTSGGRRLASSASPSRVNNLRAGHHTPSPCPVSSTANLPPPLSPNPSLDFPPGRLPANGPPPFLSSGLLIRCSPCTNCLVRCVCFAVSYCPV